MQQFLKIIECLKTDEFYTIVVEDADTNFRFTELCDNKLVVNLNGKLLTENHGSVEAFFNKIVSTGHDKIRIHFRRKSGTTCRTVGEPRVFILNPKKEEEQPVIEAVVMPKMEVESKDNFAGLKGQYLYHAMRYPEINQENAELKQKNSKLKKKVAKLERAALENHFSTSSKTEQNKFLLGLAPHLGPVLAKLIPTPAGAAQVVSEGMGSPEMSPTKIAVMQRINALNDDLCYTIGLIAENINNEDLQKDLLEIIQKHNLENE